MSAFSELKKNTEGRTPEECLDILLADIFDANGISEEDERIPVFIGTCSPDEKKSITWVNDICSAWGNPIARNPYSNNRLSTVISRYKGNFYEGERVIFIGKCQFPLEKEWEILAVDDFLSLLGIGAEENAGSKEILNAVLRRPEFRQYHQKIEQLLKNKNALEERKTELEQVEAAIEEAKAELERIKTERDEVNNLKENIDDVFPQGLEVAREEYDKLRTYLPKLRKQNEGLEEEISKCQKKLENLTQAIQEVVPEGKTVSDVFDELEEYRAHKDEIAEVLSLLKQLYNKRIELDETILQDEETRSLSFLKARIGFNYPDEIVIPFMTALATNQIITLFGKPGTGKTTFVREMAKALGAKCTMVRVQNNWTDKSDIVGYYDPVNKVYNSTEFLEAIRTAHADYCLKSDDSRLHIICLDEMNLARVEYYFAEFLSLLQDERDQQVLALLPPHMEEEAELPKGLEEYKRFLLPPNVRFVGTINTDVSTNPLSPKVIDRSFFIELSVETYAKKNPDAKREGYYPLKFFTPGESVECGISLFEKENGRFKNYMEQMYRFYKGRLSQKDDNAFASFMILAKILPAIERKADIRPAYYSLAKSKIDALMNRDGDYIDYLGGN